MAVNGTRKLNIDFYPGNKKRIDNTKVKISKGLSKSLISLQVRKNIIKDWKKIQCIIKNNTLLTKFKKDTFG